MEKCTIVVPCYNEEEAIPLFYEAVNEAVKDVNLEFEYLFVNDGSKDKTLEVMRELAEKDDRVHYISFSRNFGKEAAMYAGMKESTGDYVVIMDVDLQDPPELIPSMYESVLNEGYDCVATRRVDRKGEPPIRSMFANLFYAIMHIIAKVDMVPGARDYRFMKRNMVDSIVSMGEYNRFSKGIFGWVGFETKWVPFENRKRVAGRTKWSFFKLFQYSLEGIVAFSTAPLVWSSIVGMLFCLISFAALIFLFIRALVFGDPVSGWPSLACMITLSAGIQLFCFGIMGMYMSKTYLEVKGRPIYIVKEKK
ncbi:MAG: glycosyltransferase family 2 protein [Lachnospiraceae bacterium]|jgi:glycosyltransferase involved in cell wall biosynthesis|nr:glycosyltransferase family 2 protein [Lachnospiraceae bacterium]MBP5275355.1 glycosyltransferase family 2 protein [Lachnospiraceae bacterium]MBP5564348.1 glycosyltransferase family 2 protein [Lachnospiraceae bacterium]